MILDLLTEYASHVEHRGADGYDKARKALSFQRVFGSPEGQIVLTELMFMSNALRPVMESEHALAIAEGYRAFMVDIIREVTAQVDPEAKTVNYRI